MGGAVVPGFVETDLAGLLAGAEEVPGGEAKGWRSKASYSAGGSNGRIPSTRVIMLSA